MKRKSTAFEVLCLVAMLTPTCAPPPEPEPEVAAEPPFDRAAEEAAIEASHEEFYVDYNSHDVEKIAASFHDDTLVLFDEVVTGRATLKKEYEEIFERNKGIQIERPEEFPTIFLTPDVAIKRGRRIVTTDHDAEGDHAHDPNAFVAIVFVKKDGEWRRAAIFEMHTD